MAQVIDLDEIQRRIAAQQGVSAQTLPERKLARPIMNRLWLRLTELFGTQFTNSFGTDVDPDDVWAKALFGLTAEQIAHGLGECVRRHLEWPPNAAKFRGLCEGGEPMWQHGSEAYKPFPGPALPDKTGEERREAVGREYLARMRRELGMEATS